MLSLLVLSATTMAQTCPLPESLGDLGGTSRSIWLLPDDPGQDSEGVYVERVPYVGRAVPVPEHSLAGPLLMRVSVDGAHTVYFSVSEDGQCALQRITSFQLNDAVQHTCPLRLKGPLPEQVSIAEQTTTQATPEGIPQHTTYNAIATLGDGVVVVEGPDRFFSGDLQLSYNQLSVQVPIRWSPEGCPEITGSVAFLKPPPATAEARWVELYGCGHGRLTWVELREGQPVPILAEQRCRAKLVQSPDFVQQQPPDLSGHRTIEAAPGAIIEL